MNLSSAYLPSAILLVTAKIAGKHVVYVSVRSDIYIVVSYLRFLPCLYKKVFSFQMYLIDNLATVGNGGEANYGKDGRLFKRGCFVIASLVAIRSIGIVRI